MDGIKRPDSMVVAPGIPVAGSLPGNAGPDRVDAPKAAGVGRAPARPSDMRQLELRGLARDMAAAPPVDQARVAALKAQIAGGGYAIDPVRLADAMLASLRGSAG